MTIRLGEHDNRLEIRSAWRLLHELVVAPQTTTPMPSRYARYSQRCITPRHSDCGDNARMTSVEYTAGRGQFCGPQNLTSAECNLGAQNSKYSRIIGYYFDYSAIVRILCIYIHFCGRFCGPQNCPLPVVIKPFFLSSEPGKLIYVDLSATVQVLVHPSPLVSTYLHHGF